MARIGILGGTFDPPHIGHLVCAADAAVALELARVVLMPVAEPPHKASRGAGAPQRLAMCELAVTGETGLDVCALEIERGAPSFTVDTLREIHGTRPEDDLTFIVGSDMAASFAGWREPEAILELAELGVAGREGVGEQALRATLDGLAGPGRVRFFDMPRLDVSSSMIRERVAAGRPIGHLVPAPVRDYVHEHGLYRAAGSAA